MTLPRGKSFLGRFAERIGDFRESARLAQEQTGKSLATQLREIRALRALGGQCGATDYYWFKLYDDEYQEGRGPPDFIGWRLQEAFSLALNPRFAVLPAWDKLVFAALASAAGLPLPTIRACFHPATRVSEALGLHFSDKGALARYLRDPSVYPLFGKPAFSQQGYGAAYLAGYDPATDGLDLLGGKKIAVETFLRRMDETVHRGYHKPESGFLFQEVCINAHEIQELTKWPAICGVRVVCLNGREGVKPIRAAWKIAVAPNFTDNFEEGNNGNLFANINIGTGEVTRVTGGLWPRTQVFTKHPTTGRSFEGFRLPAWSEVLDICRRGGESFPLMKIQHWDFALTVHGPVILELNDIGGIRLAQLHGHGLLTEQTRAFLKLYGDVSTHPWIGKL